MIDKVKTDVLGARVLVNIPFRLVVYVAVLSLQQSGLIVISTVCAVVQEPNEVRAVRLEVEFDQFGVVWCLDRNLAQRCESSEVVSQTARELSGCNTRRGGWNRIGIGILIVHCCKRIRADAVNE